MRKVVAYFRSITLKGVLENIGLLLLVYLLIHTYQTWNVPKGKAPEISGINLQTSTPVSLKKMQKPVLVHFWATWCKICQFERASIASIARDYPVFSVASQSGSAQAVKQFIAREGVTFPVVLDPDGKLFKQWGGVGFPTSFVVNKNNEITFVEAGFTTELGLRARLALANFF